MELTQDTILKFLIDHGGQARNGDLLSKFKGLINCSDPVEKVQNRELFKRFVNNVAVVQQIDGVKHVALKKKYQHLLQGNLDLYVQDTDMEETESPRSSSSLDYVFSQRDKGKMLSSFNASSTVSKEESFVRNSRRYAVLSSRIGDTLTEVRPLKSNLDSGKESDERLAKTGKPDLQKMQMQAIKEAQKVTQKPYMLPLRMPPPEIRVELPEAEVAVGPCKSLPEVTVDRSPRTRRRQFEESSPASSPHLRRANKSAKPGEDPSSTATIPLEASEHKWTVMTASGLWSQVYGLLLQDTHLARKRDFMSGFTALHWAAKSGNGEMVCKLIEIAKRGGATLDINARAHGGYSPLHIAAIHNHESVMKLLVQEYGASVHLRDNSGKKPFHYLQSNTSPDLRKLLGDPKIPTQELTSQEKPEEDYVPELPKGFNTLSRIFQPYVGHKKKTKMRPGLYSLSEGMVDDSHVKRRPVSDIFN